MPRGKPSAKKTTAQTKGTAPETPDGNEGLEPSVLDSEVGIDTFEDVYDDDDDDSTFDEYNDKEVDALVALKNLLDSDRKGIESYAISRISSDVENVVQAFSNLINTVETLSTIFGEEFKKKSATFVGKSLLGLSNEFSRRFPSSKDATHITRSQTEEANIPKVREARPGYTPGAASGNGGIPVRRSSDGVVLGDVKPQGKEILIGGSKNNNTNTINVTAASRQQESSEEDYAICVADGCDWSGPETECKRKVAGNNVILSCPECGSKIA